MKKVSKKQAKKNRELAKIKNELNGRCYFCNRQGADLMHVLPKSLFPQYYTEKWNFILGCREHHLMFDDDRNFRSRQKYLYLTAIFNADIKDKGLIDKYFGKI